MDVINWLVSNWELVFAVLFVVSEVLAISPLQQNSIAQYFIEFMRGVDKQAKAVKRK